MKNKEFDMIVYGATSFVGQILCRYLVDQHKEPNFTWVMAARSESKLQELKQSLGAEADAIPTIVADSFDEDAMRGLCERAEVIISTVGPYALYGELLVKACAESGTDYCDLTGEAQWIKRMIAAYEDKAKASGARIVHCCGFDSIPSDLGVKFLQEQAQQQFGANCTQVKMGVKAMQGGASGGTIASGINLYKEAAKDPELREELKDLYSLCPAEHGNEARQHVVSRAEYIDEFKSWSGPFIMAGINVRIVLRSNAITNGSYGLPFKYFEASLTGDGVAGEKRAKRLARGSGLIGLVMVLPPLRWLATTFFLPKPGEGPSPEQQEKGFFDIRIHGRTDNDDQMVVKVTGDRDPGYGSTAKMLAQAAISLHRDVDKSEKGGGIWTPAAVFGADMFRRLESYAGLSFEVLETKPSTDGGEEQE